jgi:hypothetical protein
MIILKLFSIQKLSHNNIILKGKGSESFPFFITMKPSFIFFSLRFPVFFFTLLFLVILLISSCDYLSLDQLYPPGRAISQSKPTIVDTLIIHDTLLIPQSQNLIKLIVNSVKVDSAYGNLSGDKMIDGIPAFVNGKETNSRWAVEGYPHYAVFYFDHLVTINKIRFNLYKGDQGYSNHIKFYNFSDLIWEGDIGDSLWNNIHLNFYGSMIYLEVSSPSTKLIGKTNDWTDIGEVEFYGY